MKIYNPNPSFSSIFAVRNPCKKLCGKIKSERDNPQYKEAMMNKGSVINPDKVGVVSARAGTATPSAATATAAAKQELSVFIELQLLQPPPVRPRLEATPCRNLFSSSCCSRRSWASRSWRSDSRSPIPSLSSSAARCWPSSPICRASS